MPQTDIRIFRRGRIMSTYPFMWKLEFKQIAKSRVHLGIPIMSDIKSTEAIIKSCDKGLFGICNFQRNFNPITHIKSA